MSSLSMFQTLLVFNDFGLLLLRIVLGLIFLVHGWPKIKNLKETHANFEMMGFKPGAFWGTIVAMVEFFGGLLLIAGLFTQLAAILIAIQMLVATAWKMKRKQKLAGGYEFDLLLVASALVLATSGSGLVSLDTYLRLL